MQEHEAAYSYTRDDDFTGMQAAAVAAALGVAFEKLRRYRAIEGWARRVVDEFLRNASNDSADALFRSVFGAYGLDIRNLLLSQDITAPLKLAAATNAQLIQSIPAQYLDKVQNAVLNGVTTGKRYTAIADEIQALTGATEYRAKVIARDQTAKLNSALAEIRQTSLGIEEYEWSTAGDERVRESHAANNGQRFRWDAPPEETGHPGHDIMCRCVALGVVKIDGYDEPEKEPDETLEQSGKGGGTSETAANLIGGAAIAREWPGLERNAARYVLSEGMKDGMEHLSAFDAVTGKEMGKFTSGLEGRVAIPESLVRKLDDKSVAAELHHNHPASVSISGRDLEYLARPGVHRVVAHGHDGSVFSAMRGEGIKQLGMASNAARMEVISQLRVRGIESDVLDAHLAHLTNLALDRAGIIRYSFSLAAQQKAVYAANAVIFEKAIEEAVFAIKRIRK